MKCKNCPPRRKHGAKQSQPQDSLTENSSDVQVNNVIAQLQQQGNKLQGGPRIIDFVLIRPAMARYIDHRARNSTMEQITPNCY